jgi:hypothetical protein
VQAPAGRRLTIVSSVVPHTTVRARACTFCSTAMGTAFRSECPSCGWQMGWELAGESRDSTGNHTLHFTPEPRIRLGRFSILLFSAGGITCLLYGFNAGILVTATTVNLTVPVLEKNKVIIAPARVVPKGGRRRQGASVASVASVVKRQLPRPNATGGKFRR